MYLILSINYIYLQKNIFMELYEYIRKYRELSSMTQTMFAEEIFNNTNGKIKPTVGVVNGIERGGAITDKNLYDYLCKEFLFVDPKKNNMVADLSFEIASYCASHDINLDFTELFSFITLDDIEMYLSSKVEDIEAISKNISIVFTLLSDIVDIKLDQGSSNLSVINDTAIFVFNIYFWYFLLTTDEPERISKEEYSSDEFTEIAKIFGFHEFATTSEKAKGKIAKTIRKRFSIFEHYYKLCEKIDFDSYYDEKVIKPYFASISKLSGELDNVFNETTLGKDMFNNIVSMVISEDKETNDIVVQKLMCLYKIRNLLFNLYSFFQGRIGIPSLKYVELLRDKFDSCNIFNTNPNLRVTVNSLIDEFRGIMGNPEVYYQTPNLLFKATYIQNTLFDIYKYNYIIKSKIDMLDK